MKIKDVVRLLKPFRAELITGEHELDRDVTMIEVMEVPEVEYWASPGLLIITTFYSVKNNPSKQYDIIKKLITSGASGIIVKVGRFIQNLSREVVQLCNYHNFPLIILSEDIPYRDILRPLNLFLYSSELQAEDDHEIFSSFEKKSFHSVEEAIEYLANYLKCSIYIEDFKGRLLSSTKKLYRDGWRDSRLLYSTPYLKNYELVLNDWIKKTNSHISKIIPDFPGFKDRIIIPLILRGKHIVFIHLVFNQRIGYNLITDDHIKIIQHKSHEIIMGELIGLQQQHMTLKDIHSPNKQKRINNQLCVLLYFNRKLNEFICREQHFFIDYTSLFQKNVAHLMNNIPHVEHYIVFENNIDTYVLLSFKKKDMLSTLQLQDYLTNAINSSVIDDTFIAISSVFNCLNELDERISILKKIMDIGKQTYIDGNIFLQNQLGIYEFLIKLSTKREVYKYVDGVLGPLKQSEPVLLETLQIYLQENGNTTRTAEKLFVNRRTITNRLQKIKHLLGKNLNDAENVFILQFCLKMLKLR